MLKYNRELKKGLGGLYEFVLRLLKRLFLVFFRGDLDKILQRHLELMKVYLSDRALQSRDAWPQSYQIGKSWNAYYLYGKPGNSGENSYATVLRGGNFFGKKVMPFEVFPFPVFTERTKISCTIFLDYQCQAPSREKAKNLPVFCKWYNSIPFLFSVPKKNTSDI